MKRVWALLTLAFMLGCQPYLDHETPVYDLTQDFVDFGHKRQLKLLSVKGDRNSLLLVFNQPLRVLGDDRVNPPFEAKIRPLLSVEKAELEGLAGVRLTFSRPAPAAQEFRVIVPRGWRALSGASYLWETSHPWNTPRPELVHLDSKLGGQSKRGLLLNPKVPVVLRFNQPVSEDSLRSCLRVESLDDNEHGPFSLSTSNEEATEFELQFGTLEPQSDYRLVLDAGVKGLEGQLASSQVLERRVSTQRELKYLGPPTQKLDSQGRMELSFSAPVAPEELERLLWIPGGSKFELQARVASQSHLVAFPEPRPEEVTLLSGLRSLDGRSLATDVVIPLPKPEKVEEAAQVPLTPVTLTPGSTRLGAFMAEKTRTLTWPLSLPQALAVSAVDEAGWSSKEKIAWERRGPLFKTPKVKKPPKPKPGAAKPKPKEEVPKDSFLSPKEKKKTGFYLVQRRTGEAVSRALVVRSDLELSYATEPGAVRVSGRSRRLDRPRAGAVAELFDDKGQVLDSLRLDAQGGGRFVLDPQSRPYAVGLRWGPDRTFMPLQGLREALAEPEVAFVSLDLIHHRPGERAILYGFAWPQGDYQAETLSYRVVASDGEEWGQATVPVSSEGLFEARFMTPQKAGNYTVELSVPRADGSLEVLTETLRVGRLLPNYEEYRMELPPEPLKAGQLLTGRIDFHGPRHDELRLSATLRPEPPPLPVGGWGQKELKRPRWLELNSQVDLLDQKFSVQIPDILEGSPVLHLELFDPKAKVEVAELQQKIPTSRARLELIVDGPRPAVGVTQELTLKVHTAEPRKTILESRVWFQAPDAENDQEWSEVESHSFQSMDGDEPWRIGFSKPGRYRLDGVVIDDVSGMVVTQWYTEVATPATDLEFQLQLGTLRAAPGEELKPRVKGLAQGVALQTSLYGSEFQLGRREIVGEDGALLPIEVPNARAEQLVFAAQILPAPAFGVQRVGPLEGEVVLKLDPRSRQLGLELELPESVDAGARMEVTLKLPEGTSPVKGFLLARTERSLFQTEYPSLYGSLVSRRDDLTRADLENDLRLLEPQNDDVTFFRGGIVAGEGETTLELIAPEEPGTYYWHFVGIDEQLRTCSAETSVSVESASDWVPVTPSAVRVSDSFEAGMRFQASQQERAPLGLTASITEQGSLKPSSYFSTNALVKPGMVDELVFHYFLSAEETLRSPLDLHWRLGLEGRRHEQWAGVPVVPVPTVGDTQRQGRLTDGGRVRLDVDELERWALWLRPAGEASGTLELRDPKGVHGVITVDKRQRIEGRGPGVVELVHEQGADIDYVLEALKPDEGDSKSFGERLYVMRSLTDLESKPVPADRLRKGERYLGVLHVLNPQPLTDVTFRIPLPGGVVPQRILGEQYNPDWKWEDGEVVFTAAHVPVGEFTWKVVFQASSAGDYLWPLAELTDPAGRQLAHSGSGRVVISP